MEEYTAFKPIFKNFKKYVDVWKHSQRVTNLTLLIYKIDETFAQKYLHEKNSEIFNLFLRTYWEMRRYCKANFDFYWDISFIGEHGYVNPAGKSKNLGILNRCIVVYRKKYKNRLNLWERVQKHKDLFKIL